MAAKSKIEKAREILKSLGRPTKLRRGRAMKAEAIAEAGRVQVAALPGGRWWTNVKSKWGLFERMHDVDRELVTCLVAVRLLDNDSAVTVIAGINEAREQYDDKYHLPWLRKDAKRLGYKLVKSRN